MKEYPWNEVVEVNRYFWDHQTQEETIITGGSLKARLSNPERRRIEDLLRDCAQGIHMLMEHVEESDEKLAKIAKVVKGL